MGIVPLHGSGKKPVRAAGTPILVDIPDIVSNLDTGGRRASFIKMHVKIEVLGEDAAAKLQEQNARVLDIFQTYLRSTRPDELQGGEDTYRLREALMNRIDVALAPIQVQDVLFTSILVQ